MPDPFRKGDRNPEKTTPRKDKICKTCGRAFAWRKQWEQDWDIVKYCSDACRGYQTGEADSALEAAILELLAERGRDKTLDPSEAAKLVGGQDTRRDWEGLMPPARAAARRLAAQGRLAVIQSGKAVDPAKAKGAILVKLP